MLNIVGSPWSSIEQIGFILQWLGIKRRRRELEYGTGPGTGNQKYR